jgi:outer membrane lipoprotein carrier protein
MRLFALLAILSLSLWSQPAPDTTVVLRGVEKLYNSTKTLQANFTVNFKDRGRPRAPERGVLYLSKQGSTSRTRWDYSSPAGNVFLSDGKFVYDYDKQKNAADRYPYKETEDMRIPLSFLLGKLDFNKDFEKFDSKPDGASTAITMTPRNKKLLFKEIAIVVAPDFTIRRVTVTDQPGTSVMEYVLEGEQRNLKLAEALFKFTLPAGAQVVDTKQ